MVTENNALFERMAQDESDLGLLAAHKNDATRTIHLEPDENFQRHALTALTHSHGAERADGSDKSGNKTLLFSMKETQYFGGWGQGYPNVNTEKLEEAKQKSCVIGLDSRAYVDGDVAVPGHGQARGCAVRRTSGCSTSRGTRAVASATMARPESRPSGPMRKSAAPC